MLLDRYAAAVDAGSEPEGDPFRVGHLHGDRVLLSAPHAAAHLRHDNPGEAKLADLFTGELVQVVAAHTGAAAMWVRPPWPGNANADPSEICPYKQQVLRAAAEGFTVLDVHGMSDSHGLQVCIGTAGRPGRAAGVAVACCEALELSYAVDEPFDARRPGTVTSAVLAGGGDAVQLELAWSLRDPEGDAYLALSLLAGIVDALTGRPATTSSSTPVPGP